MDQETINNMEKNKAGPCSQHLLTSDFQKTIVQAVGEHGCHSSTSRQRQEDLECSINNKKPRDGHRGSS